MQVKGEIVLDRTTWKNDTQYYSGDPRWWEKTEVKKKEYAT